MIDRYDCTKKMGKPSMATYSDGRFVLHSDHMAALIAEQELSAAISRDCNETANQRNAALAALAAAEARVAVLEGALRGLCADAGKVDALCSKTNKLDRERLLGRQLVVHIECLRAALAPPVGEPETGK